MFALTMGADMDMGFPDVCLTPIPSPVGPVPIPIPYPNMQVSATSTPAAYNVLMDCTPALTQASLGLVSVGDEPSQPTLLTLGGTALHHLTRNGWRNES